MKKILTLFLITVLWSSCTPSLEDCDGKTELLSGAWVVKEVFIDGIKQESASYGAFNLTLQDGGAYTRRQPSGFPDNGEWKLDSGDTMLVLMPSASPDESYILQSFTLREMTLVLNRTSTKSGPSQLIYILIPEKK